MVSSATCQGRSCSALTNAHVTLALDIAECTFDLDIVHTDSCHCSSGHSGCPPAEARGHEWADVAPGQTVKLADESGRYHPHWASAICRLPSSVCVVCLWRCNFYCICTKLTVWYMYLSVCVCRCAGESYCPEKLDWIYKIKFRFQLRYGFRQSRWINKWESHRVVSRLPSQRIPCTQAALSFDKHIHTCMHT